MNKTQLIDMIAEEAQITKVAAKRALDAFIKITGQTLKEGGSLTLTGFGAFSVQHRTERIGRNMKTKAPIKIPPKNVAKFRPSSELNGMLN